MKKSKIKKAGIITGLVAIVLGGVSLWSNCQPRARITIPERAAVTVDLTEQRRKILYESINNYNNEFFNGDNTFEGYVEFMASGSLWSGYSNEIKKNIDYYAKQNNNSREKGKAVVVKGYVDLQKLCLALAVDRLDQEINEKDVDEYAERCVDHMRSIVKITPLDYEHPAVKEGYKSFVKQRAGWFKRVINSNLKNPRIEELKKASEERKDDKGFLFREIIKNNYSQEQFRTELEEYEQSKVLLYQGFADSLSNYRGWDAFFVKTFGPKIAKKTGERSKEINIKEAERIYAK